ncbi:hypothetical protein BMF94_0703 [Rhodotorula taiwanensis]|uniref:Uncharacterized protein n=1 Tax=Rhodotorula taiwanensis TaxID=741276 RepID=A0A2S5BIA1_9BASI|nr:hypothetical protein BMF94_0703 [Rhodotorula taiwanensis]
METPVDESTGLLQSTIAISKGSPSYADFRERLENVTIAASAPDWPAATKRDGKLAHVARAAREWAAKLFEAVPEHTLWEEWSVHAKRGCICFLRALAQELKARVDNGQTPAALQGYLHDDVTLPNVDSRLLLWNE